MKSITIAAAILSLSTLSAEARHRHHRVNGHHGHQVQEVSTEPCLFFCAQPQSGDSNKPIQHSRSARAVGTGWAPSVFTQRALADGQRDARQSTVVNGRPSGCPHRYCGCQASLEIFGRIIPDLNLAANWLRLFPHVPHGSGAPGMAAARSGHVVVLREHKHGDFWEVKDGNTRGHLTRIHVINVASYTFVDPRGGRIAMN